MTMLGDFRYCSSSSGSNSEDECSDSSMRPEEYTENLVSKKKDYEEKIKECEVKLAKLHDTLRKLNAERKMLFAAKKKMMKSTPGSSNIITLNPVIVSSDAVNTSESEELILPNAVTEPLNLDPQVSTKDDEEELDSDDEFLFVDPSLPNKVEVKEFDTDDNA